MLDNVWKEWLDRIRLSGRRDTQRALHRRGRCVRERVEVLEDRIVPAVTSVLSIARTVPTTTEITTPSVAYTVNFNTSVTGVDASDFRVVTDGTVKAASPIVVTRLSSSLYKVTINGIHGTGDLRLDLIDNDSITHGSARLGGTGVNNGSFQGQEYVVNSVAPRVVSIVGTNPGGLTSAGGNLNYRVTFSEAVTGVDASDFALALTGTAHAGTTPITVTRVTSSVYTVRVNGVTGSGSVGLNLVDNGSIRDTSGDPLAASDGSIAFQNQVTYDTGDQSYEVVVADLNRDGRPDLIVGNHGANTVGVLLGNGNGTFQAQNTYATSGPPGGIWSLVAADVNGDGIPDVIAGNSGSTAVSVLISKGNGTFATPVTFDVGAGVRGPLAAADVNGDGKADLLISNGDSDTVSVLLGIGNGTFLPQLTFATGRLPRQVVAGDVNGDGELDLIVANGNGVSVSVLLGNGDGTFQDQITFAAGGSVGNTKFMSVADLDRDGNLDIVITDGNANTVNVLIGNGDGSFQDQVTYAVGDTPQPVQVADMNSDGVPDLIVGNWGPTSNSVGVLLGNGDGTFQPEINFATGLAPHAVPVADVNGDGRPDIIVANEYSNSVSVLLSSTKGNFTGQVYTIT